MQSVEALPPVDDLYVPAAQLVLFVPPVQYLPAGQAAQSVEALPPVDVLYVPAAHCVRAVPPVQ